MIPYYIIRLDDTHFCDSYSSATQTTLQGVRDIGQEFSYRLLKSFNVGNIEFSKYNLRCEFEHNKKGRAYGIERYFDKYFILEEDNFYYCPSDKVLILCVNKDVFHRFHKEFETQNNLPNLKKVEVDFENIVRNQKSLGIEGIWLGKYPDSNINGSYFHGNKIETSETYHDLLEQGANIKNITIIYNFVKQEKVMITKEGGIVTYEHNNVNDALPLILDIYNNLLN